MSYFNPHSYQKMVSQYLEHQNNLREQKRLSKIKEDEEVAEMKKKLEMYEKKEKADEAKKEVHLENRLKGDDRAARAEKMRKAKKAHQEEKDLPVLQEFMDKDLAELKDEHKKAQQKVRLLKKFTTDIQKNIIK